MNSPTHSQINEIRAGFKQGRESELVGPNAAAFHGSEEVEGVLEGLGEGGGLDDGVEEEDVRVLGLVKD